MPTNQTTIAPMPALDHTQETLAACQHRCGNCRVPQAGPGDAPGNSPAAKCAESMANSLRRKLPVTTFFVPW